MDKLAIALGPAFAGGLAIQQLLELLDPLFPKALEAKKKIVLSIVALAIGLLLAWLAGLQVLEPLQVHHATLDIFVTGLIISGGTQGLNSLVKFMGYAKEDKKAGAAAKAATADKKEALMSGKTV